MLEILEEILVFLLGK